MKTYVCEVKYNDCDGKHKNLLVINAPNKREAIGRAEAFCEVSPDAHDVWNVDISCKEAQLLEE